MATTTEKSSPTASPPSSSSSFSNSNNSITIVNVDVIIPVHNASKTVYESVHSALRQTIPSRLLSRIEEENVNNENNNNSVYKPPDEYSRYPLDNVRIDITVCCYDDGSIDDSLDILRGMVATMENNGKEQWEGDGKEVVDDDILVDDSDTMGEKGLEVRVIKKIGCDYHNNDDAGSCGNSTKLSTRLIVGWNSSNDSTNEDMSKSKKISRGAGYARCEKKMMMKKKTNIVINE